MAPTASRASASTFNPGARPEEAKHRPISRFAPFLLVLLILAVFGVSLGADFTSWDDISHIAHNSRLNPVTPASVAAFWRAPFFGLYIPLTYTVWAALALVARVPTPDGSGYTLNPYIFHAANLLVHALSALVVYAILRRILRALKSPAGASANWAAFAGAALFAIHPVQVESVAWVSGMRDLLSGLFCLIAIWQFLIFIPSTRESAEIASDTFEESVARAARPFFGSREPRASRPCHAKTELSSSNDASPAWHYALATLAYGLALLAKPSAVVTPLLAMALGAFVYRRGAWRRAAWLVPWLVMAAAIVLVTHVAQPVRTVADGGRWQLRPLIAADALAFYVYKLFLPIRLGILYNRAPVVVISHGWLYFTWIAPLAAFLAAWILRRRAPWLIAALVFFTIALLPVLGLTPFDFQTHSTVADHYLYVAMFGPSLAIACWLAREPAGAQVQTRTVDAIGTLATSEIAHERDTADERSTSNEHARGRRRSSKHPPSTAPAFLRPHSRKAAGWACAIAIALLALRAAFQTLTWDNSISLFENAIQVNPHAIEAWNNLGLAYVDANRNADALRAYQAGLAIAPASAPLHINLGTLLATEGRLHEAAREYAIANRLDPTSDAARAGMQAAAQALRTQSNGPSQSPKNTPDSPTTHLTPAPQPIK